jgi:hypothetical protein
MDDCVVDDCAVDGRVIDNLTMSFRKEYRVLMTPRVYVTIPFLVSQFSYIKEGLFAKWRNFQVSFLTSPTMKKTSERLCSEQ